MISSIAFQQGFTPKLPLPPLPQARAHPVHSMRNIQSIPFFINLPLLEFAGGVCAFPLAAIERPCSADNAFVAVACRCARLSRPDTSPAIGNDAGGGSSVLPPVQPSPAFPPDMANLYALCHVKEAKTPWLLLRGHPSVFHAGSLPDVTPQSSCTALLRSIFAVPGSSPPSTDGSPLRGSECHGEAGRPAPGVSIAGSCRAIRCRCLHHVGE